MVDSYWLIIVGASCGLCTNPVCAGQSSPTMYKPSLCGTIITHNVNSEGFEHYCLELEMRLKPLNGLVVWLSFKDWLLRMGRNHLTNTSNKQTFNTCQEPKCFVCIWFESIMTCDLYVQVVIGFCNQMLRNQTNQPVYATESSMRRRCLKPKPAHAQQQWRAMVEFTSKTCDRKLNRKATSQILISCCDMPPWQEATVPKKK